MTCYCSSVWSPYLKNDKTALESEQRSATTNITGFFVMS